VALGGKHAPEERCHPKAFGIATANSSSVRHGPGTNPEAKVHTVHFQANRRGRQCHPQNRGVVQKRFVLDIAALNHAKIVISDVPNHQNLPQDIKRFFTSDSDDDWALDGRKPGIHLTSQKPSY
jgi:hypothetical protein